MGRQNHGFPRMWWRDLQCTIADEVAAIDAAVAKGAQVINLSLGGIGTNDLESEAIQNAYNAGVTIVAAAGNANPGVLYQATGNPSQDKANLYYPAAFPQVIGVAALDNKGGSITDPLKLTKAGFSNYGEDIVSVAAVGTDVETTVPYMPKDQVPYAIYSVPNYTRLSGTSFACPQVTGLAALVISKNPSLGPADVRNIIEKGAHSLGGPDTDNNSVDDYLGYGVIDAGQSLGAADTVKNAIHENTDFLAGITASPIYNHDFYLIVKCKNGSDLPPSASYFIKSTAENGAIEFESLPAYPNTYLGRFHTLGTGSTTIMISGVMGQKPLQNLQFTYVIE